MRERLSKIWFVNVIWRTNDFRTSEKNSNRIRNPKSMHYMFQWLEQRSYAYYMFKKTVSNEDFSVKASCQVRPIHSKFYSKETRIPINGILSSNRFLNCGENQLLTQASQTEHVVHEKIIGAANVDAFDDICLAPFHRCSFFLCFFSLSSMLCCSRWRCCFFGYRWFSIAVFVYVFIGQWVRRNKTDTMMNFPKSIFVGVERERVQMNAILRNRFSLAFSKWNFRFHFLLLSIMLLFLAVLAF